MTNSYVEMRACAKAKQLLVFYLAFSLQLDGKVSASSSFPGTRVYVCMVDMDLETDLDEI